MKCRCGRLFFLAAGVAFVQWTAGSMAVRLEGQAHGNNTFAVETLTVGETGRSVGLKVLRNTVTGESVDIVYTSGGKLDSVRLMSPVTGKVRELILSREREAAKLFDDTSTTRGKNEVQIPFTRRIENGTYKVNGKSYFMERSAARGNHAYGGFLVGKPMRVAQERQLESQASVTLAYRFNDANDQQSKPQGYPFALSVEVTYTLDAQGLSISFVATNLATEGGPLPFVVGMFPDFKVQDVSRTAVILDPCSAWNRISFDTTSRTPTGEAKPFDVSHLSPIGGSLAKPTLYLDATFKAVASRCHSESPVLNTEIYDRSMRDSSMIWMRSPQFTFLHLYTGGTPSEGQVVSVMPMSGMENAYNNGQAADLWLQAGQTWEGSIGFSLTVPSLAARGEAKVA